MSIIAQLAIGYEFFPGFEDPSLPSGIWKGSMVAVGDASGGVVETDLVFSPIGPLNTRYYSLDQAMATYSDGGGDRLGTTSVINLGQLQTRRYNGIMRLAADASSQQVQGRDWAFLPIFLGAQINPAATSLVSFKTVNTLNEILSFTAMGYFWQARAGNAPGGPSRPVQGVFSR